MPTPSAATGYGLQATSFFSHLPLDWVLIGLLGIFLVIITLRAGPRLAGALALSFPVVAFVLTTIPSTAFVGGISGQLSAPLPQLILSLVVFVAVFFLVLRMVGQNIGGGALPLSALLCGLSATAVMVVALNQVLGSNPFWHFGPQVQAIFGPAYRLWWVLGSYIVLAFTRR